MIGRLLNWVACDGGPHLLAAREVVKYWEGTTPPSEDRVIEANFRFAGPDSPATDYDRACDVGLSSILGTIPIGGADALVLGGDVPMSAWVEHPTRAGGDMVIPLQHGEDTTDEGLVEELRAIDDTVFSGTPYWLSVGDRGLMHFAASDSGPKWAYSAREVRVNPGRYSITTLDYETEYGELLRIHRLRC